MTVLSIPIFWQYQHTRKPKEIVTLEYGHFTSLHPSWSFMRWIFLTNPSHSIFLDSLAYIALLRFGKMYSSDIVICISLICEPNLCLERSLLGPNVFAAKLTRFQHLPSFCQLVYLSSHLLCFFQCNRNNIDIL